MAQKVANVPMDVRPDRLDLRDREYQPKLRSLPDVYPDLRWWERLLPLYKRSMLILNQGQEGACTGFGLACLVNFLRWSRDWRERLVFDGCIEDVVRQVRDVESVSPRMLYHLARLYDEWPGEDYEGSSCRGAMKGWHKHGVCRERYWPYENSFVPPREGWQEDAGLTPLGAYYRINKDSVNDMQAAIHEVGAIYCSANVHDGWNRPVVRRNEHIPVIEPDEAVRGGHAFALVGYDARGFVVQNSWGSRWGMEGFAILPYRDWVENGWDAWVAVLGAPIEPAQTVGGTALRHRPLIVSGADIRAEGIFDKFRRKDDYVYRDERARRWSNETAYGHAVVMGNNGEPLNYHVTSGNAAQDYRNVLFERVEKWADATDGPRRVALYAHGGLNDEKDAIDRAAIMGPYFCANGIYPIFLAWKTGLWESLVGIVQNALTSRGIALPSKGIGEAVRRGWDAVVEAKDRTIEEIAGVAAKPLWTHMKSIAADAATEDNGLSLVARHLCDLRRKFPDLELHLVGHSAGSILLGHLLDLLGPDDDDDGGSSPPSFGRPKPPPRFPVETCTLFAPACTLEFAVQHYLPALDDGTLKKEDGRTPRLHFEILSDERERDDSVGPYGKSLLYLVSRALETRHKFPLLGMAREWLVGNAREQREHWGEQGAEWVRTWQDEVHARGIPVPEWTEADKASEYLDPKYPQIDTVHGSFDNDVRVVTRTLLRILGRDVRTGTLDVAVENLHGF